MHSSIQRMARRTAAMAGLTACGLMAFMPAASADTKTWPVGYGSADVRIGTATVERTGNNVAVSVNLTAGNTLQSSGQSPDIQVCASTSAFTSKLNPDRCESTPGGEYWSFVQSGSTPSFSFQLGRAYTGKTGYLQIHLQTDDGGTSNTSMVNPVVANPLYGNVPTDPMPVEAIGGIGLAGVAAGVLAVRQARRRHATSS